MRQLILEALKCYETEDWAGADECRLEVVTDGTLNIPLTRSLNDGQKWEIDQSYAYESSVEVKLWDEDSPDEDDCLGKLSLGTDVVMHKTTSFKGDEAHYRLWYSIVEASGSDEDQLQEAFARFGRSEKPGEWTYVSKQALLADMRTKIANPLMVDQGRTPLCGPASIVFELVSRVPLRYVQICQELYETGRFRARTKNVSPAESLVKGKLRKGISLADWMLMATLRDTENAIFDVDPDSGNFVLGLTTPWEMEDWLFELLGYDDADFESTYVYGEFDAMRKAQRYRNDGGVAFLMVHSAMLRDSDTIGYPNHWVSYLGNLDIDEGDPNDWDSGHIKFSCYSWGRKCHVDIGEGPFEDYFWGVVTGKP